MKQIICVEIEYSPSANSPTVHLNNLLRANNGEGHQSAKFGVLLDRVLVIFFDVVREVVAVYSVSMQICGSTVLSHTQECGSARYPP